MNRFFEEELRRQYTQLDFSTEEEAAKAFDQHAEASLLFRKILREVPGRMVYRPPYKQDGSVRLDRILFPAPHAPWSGPIGVEIKRSKEKIGRALSQCIDYQNCLFEIRPHVWFHPEWTFLFPAANLKGPVQSIISQNRVGTCCIERGQLLFWATGQRVITEQQTRLNPEAAGAKIGSR